MFARADIEVAHPFADVRAALERASSGWLAGLVEEAGRDGSQLDTIGPEGSTHQLPIRMEVQVHPAVHLGGGVWLALEWASDAPDAIFPSGAIDLEATPLVDEPDRTGLVLHASLSAAADGPWARPEQALLEVAQVYIERLAEQVSARLLDHTKA
jgi:hypothetical protein